MSAKKKSKKANSSFKGFAVIIVLLLLLANIWAGWRILKLAKALEIPLLGSVDDGPMQLATLLFINCVVIVLLIVVKEK
jgi:hypothetical protein